MMLAFELNLFEPCSRRLYQPRRRQRSAEGVNNYNADNFNPLPSGSTA